jgi:hypothetical protein
MPLSSIERHNFVPGDCRIPMAHPARGVLDVHCFGLHGQLVSDRTELPLKHLASGEGEILPNRLAQTFPYANSTSCRAHQGAPWLAAQKHVVLDNQ